MSVDNNFIQKFFLARYSKLQNDYYQFLLIYRLNKIRRYLDVLYLKQQ